MHLEPGAQKAMPRSFLVTADKWLVMSAFDDLKKENAWNLYPV